VYIFIVGGPSNTPVFKEDDGPWQFDMSECPNGDLSHDTLSDCSENISESHFQIRYQAIKFSIVLSYLKLPPVSYFLQHGQVGLTFIFTFTV
jgi:hypothetical protein